MGKTRILGAVALIAACSVGWWSRGYRESHYRIPDSTIRLMAHELARRDRERTTADPERLSPTVLCSGDGVRLTFYQDRHPADQTSDFLIYEVLDPTGPDKYHYVEDCPVASVEGRLYDVAGLTYLWWEPTDTDIFLLAFDDSRVPLREAVRMAEAIYP